MMSFRSITAVAFALSASCFSLQSYAQNCTGVPYFEACLDAIGGRPMGGGGMRDPSRIIDDIFRTTDAPARFAPQLTFGQVVLAQSEYNSPGCSGGVSSGVAGTDPRQYTAYQCVPGLTPAQAAPYTNSLDWRWTQTQRVRANGVIATDQDACGGDRVACGYEQPWRGGVVFDLQGPANRVVVFPITDHVTDSCLEAFEYSVYLTDNPASREFVRAGERPDPAKWNSANLVRAYLRGWTNNYESTGTEADMTVHPLETHRATPNEAIADSIATVWALPCGINFRYVSIVPGNGGNPDARCAFHSSEDEFDAVAGLNEDGTAICPDRDRDGFRDSACGGPDCDDTNPAINPGAIEDCRNPSDLNCDGRRTVCPMGTGCFEGICTPGCIEGACSEGFSCRMGGTPSGSYCIPSGCTTCPPGQVCGPAGCQAPCDNARCPLGQVCLGGACVGACAGVTCPTNQHCEAGSCVPNCSCTGCPTGRNCNATSGLCESPGCAALACPESERDCRGDEPRCVRSFCDGVRCPAGQICDETARACVVNRCAGISCQVGQECRDGECVASARPEPPATDGGSATDASASQDASVMDATAPIGMDASSDSGGRVDPVPMVGGCGCTTTGHSSAPNALGALGVLALGLGSRRKRKH
ncbi:MAG: putative metal-binding motif-containing protein [Deltaproteobacteria bacterium]|nr:putative metal-binding motif-containing protein [Deltaproteobacteria bacterium]